VKELTIPSFAKINLMLRVKNRNSDGYHSVDTILQSVELHDLLTFRFSKNPNLRIELDTGLSGLASDNTNLIYKAIQAFHKIHAIQAKIEVRVQKNIPVGSGLGGGSSNAAATLIALSRYFNWPFARQELVEIAQRLGTDVAFFLYGGTARGIGRGDEITPLQDATRHHVLIVDPGFTCSTAEIYRKFDQAGLLTENVNFIKILNDPGPESYRAIVSQIGNDLEKVVFAMYPELDSNKKRLLETGAVAAALTGSGSTVYGLFVKASDLEKAAQQFSARCETYFLNRTEYERRLGF
jgi:4-diphosphocytidyl-2-C-methyl-D-erythritol kinase